MPECIIGRSDEFEDGERRVVEIKGREIGVIYKDGEFRSYLNWCPHQGGPVCEGPITGQMQGSFDRDSLEEDLKWSEADQVLVCPWHSWEFDLDTGENLPDRSIKLPTFPTRVEDGDVIVEM